MTSCALYPVWAYAAEVIVTGAFFADHAASVDNKLVVVGGVWDHYFIAPGNPLAINGFLVILVQTDPNEHDEAVLAIDIFRPDGEQLSAVKAEYTIREGAGQGFFLAPLSIGLLEVGRHSFAIGVPGQPSVALWLQVHQSD